MKSLTFLSFSLHHFENTIHKNPFLLKNIQCFKEKCYVAHSYLLRIDVILWIFCSKENLLTFSAQSSKSGCRFIFKVVCISRSSSFLRLSLYLRSTLFLRSSSFSRFPSLFRSSAFLRSSSFFLLFSFLGCLHFY